MCIRDSHAADRRTVRFAESGDAEQATDRATGHWSDPLDSCLLYTSDAADERSSVDLGGRRIIKKKQRAGIERGCGT